MRGYQIKTTKNIHLMLAQLFTDPSSYATSTIYPYKFLKKLIKTFFLMYPFDYWKSIRLYSREVTEPVHGKLIKAMRPLSPKQIVNLIRYKPPAMSQASWQHIVKEYRALYSIPKNTFLRKYPNCTESSWTLAKLVDYWKGIHSNITKPQVDSDYILEYEKAYFENIHLEPDVNVIALVGNCGTGKTSYFFRDV